MIEGLPEKAVMFREGLEDGDDIGIVTEAETFIFMGSFQNGPVTPRLALALRVQENNSPEICHVHSVVLSQQTLIHLIGILQRRLQLMSQMGGDHESR